MSASLRRARLSAFLRSFAIQGGWNYRTMLGGGFAFAMLPLLRALHRGNPPALREALQRHAEHFNAHPYLASLALGAACRMEEEGTDPEEVRRFKMAVKGPLGSLGDLLVWVAWRPATVLASLTLAFLGAPPLLVAVFFLGLYNMGHLALRIWGFRLGLARGSGVADSLRSLGLPRQADRIAAAGVFFLGGVAGVSLSRGLSLEPTALLWLPPVALGMWTGARVGQKGWQPAVSGLSLLIVLLFFLGWVEWPRS